MEVEKEADSKESKTNALSFLTPIPLAITFAVIMVVAVVAMLPSNDDSTDSSNQGSQRSSSNQPFVSNCDIVDGVIPLACSFTLRQPHQGFPVEWPGGYGIEITPRKNVNYRVETVRNGKRNQAETWFGPREDNAAEIPRGDVLVIGVPYNFPGESVTFDVERIPPQYRTDNKRS